jgi:hypothetical protein
VARGHFEITHYTLLSIYTPFSWQPSGGSSGDGDGGDGSVGDGGESDPVSLHRGVSGYLCKIRTDIMCIHATKKKKCHEVLFQAVWPMGLFAHDERRCC